MDALIYHKDVPLIEEIFQYDIIIVGTGIHNSLGNGFQHDVKINFPFVEKTVKEGKYGDARKLGTVTVVSSKPMFCIAYIHKGGYRKDLNPVYLDYDALKECINMIDENFHGKKIATTLIGCCSFDGNGEWEKVEKFFLELNTDNEYHVYDYEQRDYRQVNNEKWAKIVEQIGKIPYEEMRKLKDEYIKERKYGIYADINKQ